MLMQKLNEIISAKFSEMALEKKIIGDLGHYYGFMNASSAFMTLNDLTIEQVLSGDYKSKYIGPSIKNYVLEFVKDASFNDLVNSNLGYNFSNPHKHYTKRTEVLNKIEKLMDYFIVNSIAREITGSFRRNKEYCGDLDILIIDNMIPKSDLSNIATILAYGNKKCKLLFNDLEVDIRSVTDKEFSCALQYFTGSKNHNLYIRSIYKSKGYKLNEYCITNKSTNERIYPKTEKDIYSFINIPYVNPENR